MKDEKYNVAGGCTDRNNMTRMAIALSPIILTGAIIKVINERKIKNKILIQGGVLIAGLGSAVFLNHKAKIWIKPRIVC